MGSDLKAVREHLLTLREEWQQRLGAIRADRRREHGGLDPDSGERAVERENDETLDALDERGRQAVEEFDAALARIESGEYGRCVRCGSEIPEGRLRAYPATPTCVECSR